MFNDLSSAAQYLATRRSGKARDMVAPGPNSDQLQAILQIAARTPDHGKLFPWRFVHITDRHALADLMRRAFCDANPGARPTQIEAAIAPAHMAPTLIILLHAEQASAKIPLWEQELSTGAAAMNLIHGAHAFGFVANWITGWPTYNVTINTALCADGERIAGFFFIGTAALMLEERPRPELSNIVRSWPNRTET